MSSSEKNNPINVAVAGLGWFGSGLVQELAHWPQITLKVVFEQDTQKAHEVLAVADFAKEDVTVSGDLQEIAGLNDIQVVFDATGNVLAGAKAALLAIEAGMHFITVSSELDSLIGPVLKKTADEKGVIYSNSDGDQPGVLGRLIPEVMSLGFSIELAGNCKGFLDAHKTPEDVIPWVKPGQNPKMIAAFTDGSKQSMELAVVANAFGLKPDVRGMHGIRTTKATLVEDFRKTTQSSGIVDYSLGIDGVDQGAGVFVVGRKEGGRVRVDMNYLKKGDGPDYLFFRDHHLCYIEAPRSIIDAAVYNRPTIAPAGHHADVIAIAKRDLKPGEKFDGIGGYTIYGLIEKAETVKEEVLLPFGLAEYAVTTCAIKKDTPITYEMVEFSEENVVLELRREQDNRVRS